MLRQLLRPAGQGADIERGRDGTGSNFNKGRAGLIQWSQRLAASISRRRVAGLVAATLAGTAISWLPPIPAHAAPALQLPWPAGQRHNINGGYSYHCGATHQGRDNFAIDFNLPTGSPVSAVADGTAYNVPGSTGYGNHVYIVHAGGFVSLYGHLSSFALASTPTSVAQGQVIGYSDTSGNSSGPHLHFTLRSNATSESDGTAYKPEPMSGYTGFGQYGFCGTNPSPLYTSSASGSPAPPPPPPAQSATVTTKAVVLRSDGLSGYTLDFTGVLHPFGGAPAVSSYASWTWNAARGAALCPKTDNYGYTLDLYGGLHPIGVAPPITQYASWGSDVARGLVLRPDCESGYVLDDFGGIHPFATTVANLPPQPTRYAYWNNWDIARGIVLYGNINGADSGYTLDGLGGVHPWGNAPNVTIQNSFTSDIARGLVLATLPEYQVDPAFGFLASDGTNPSFGACCTGYLLDGYGGVHPWGAAPTTASPAYWNGVDKARGFAFSPGLAIGYYTDGTGTLYSFRPNVPVTRGVVLLPDGHSGYTLDGNGAFHPFGNGAPPITNYASWTSDVARGAVLCPTLDGSGLPFGYTLDMLGGVHPVGSSAAITSYASWPTDVARAIVLRPDCQSGYVLDMSGGAHPFASASVSVPPQPSTAYWPNQDLARGIVLNGTDGASGYTLDAWGGVHPFGLAPAVTGAAYWPNQDVARGIVLSLDTVSGYTLDYWGGLHPFGAALPITQDGYWPNQDIAKGVVYNSLLENGYYVNKFGGLYIFKAA